jgi:hypothetical protein
MVSFAKSDMLAACANYGTLLKVPAGVDGVRCMTALASNESSLGANCGPRPEPFYQHSKQPEQVALNAQYGEIAWSSHGPWQMMFENFTPETQQAIANGPVQLSDYATEFVRFFNMYVITVRHAATLDQIGEVWNLGHIGPDPAYTQKLETAYSAA